MAARRRPSTTIAEITMEIIATELRKMKPDTDKVEAHYRALGEQLETRYGVKVSSGRTQASP